MFRVSEVLSRVVDDEASGQRAQRGTGRRGSLSRQQNAYPMKLDVLHEGVDHDPRLMPKLPAPIRSQPGRLPRGVPAVWQSARSKQRGRAPAGLLALRRRQFGATGRGTWLPDG